MEHHNMHSVELDVWDEVLGAWSTIGNSHRTREHAIAEAKHRKSLDEGDGIYRYYSVHEESRTVI